MFDDFWVFNTSTSEYMQLNASPGPTKRCYHAMAAAGTDLFLFGGIKRKATGNDVPFVQFDKLDDLWIYKTTTAQWTQHNSVGARQTPRFSHAMAGVGSDAIFLHGGQDKDFVDYETGSCACAAYTPEYLRRTVVPLTLVRGLTLF